MKLDDLETRMRVFETAHDHQVLPGLFMVARLDGRGFTKLVRERRLKRCRLKRCQALFLGYVR